MNIPMLRPTWAEIDLAKLTRNVQKIRTLTGPHVKLLAVLKANAYGHGAVALGQFLQKQGLAQFFGTASIEEALQLRQAGITLPILALGSVYPFEAFEYAIANDIAITIASMDAAKAVKEVAAKLRKTALCHVKQDTGMGRIGTRRAGVVHIARELAGAPYVVVDGLFTHLSSVEADPAFTEEQIGYFRDALTGIRLGGLHVNHTHMAASAALLSRVDTHGDMVRAGHALYGLEDGFEPVLSLKTRIVYLKDLPAGGSVSYNRSFVAQKPIKVATVPLGYGDGYLRALSNKAHMLVNGVPCPVLGNVTMDMTMLDVTAAGPVPIGAEVLAAGTQNGKTISFANLALEAGTIDYELTTLITARVPRSYV